MKKNIGLALFIILLIIVIGFAFYFITLQKEQDTKQVPEINNTLSIANPASTYCISQGGKSEIRNNPDGQVGICVFNDGSECDEWVFFRKECEKGQSNIDMNLEIKNLEKILTEEVGVDFSKMKIIINKNFGKYISGSIVPIESGIAGGGYLYAEKIDGKWNIVASGNGQINCNIFDTYKDFPASMISECVNEKGEIESRELVQ